MQVFGGHGYIKEHGMEQIARDARISTLYEGTTGIQALDLLGRKVLLQTRGKCRARIHRRHPEVRLRPPCPQQEDLRPLWLGTDQALPRSGTTSPRASCSPPRKERDIGGRASADFLMYSGYTTMAYFWALHGCQGARETRRR
jgi:hypothetical protein